MSIFQTQSFHLQELYDSLMAGLMYQINSLEERCRVYYDRDSGMVHNQPSMEYWVQMKTNCESKKWEHEEWYIYCMEDDELKVFMGEIQKYFKDEYDMNIFDFCEDLNSYSVDINTEEVKVTWYKGFSDIQLTKYAHFYCGRFISRLSYDELKANRKQHSTYVEVLKYSNEESVSDSSFFDALLYDEEEGVSDSSLWDAVDNLYGEDDDL